MSGNEIWVVVAADEQAACIFANRHGSSRLVERLVMPARPPVAAEAKIVRLVRPGAPLARQLMDRLVEGAARNAYEGILIVVSPAMRSQLRLVMDRRIQSLIIAEIVESAAAPACLSTKRSAVL